MLAFVAAAGGEISSGKMVSEQLACEPFAIAVTVRLAPSLRSLSSLLSPLSALLSPLSSPLSLSSVSPHSLRSPLLSLLSSPPYSLLSLSLSPPSSPLSSVSPLTSLSRRPSLLHVLSTPVNSQLNATPLGCFEHFLPGPTSRPPSLSAGL